MDTMYVTQPSDVGMIEQNHSETSLWQFGTRLQISHNHTTTGIYQSATPAADHLQDNVQHTNMLPPGIGRAGRSAQPEGGGSSGTAVLRSCSMCCPSCLTPLR